MIEKEALSSALYAGIIGDALGVPVESTPRQELAFSAVKNMLGFGRYDQPRGTWSDDSSLTLCTMESLLRGYDLEDLAATFSRWLFDSHWTPTGYVFDVGLTTYVALDNIRNDKKSARESGCDGEDDNGNGSLMRMLPAALFFRKEPTEPFLQRIHEISAVTHKHPRALMGCGIYSLFVRELLKCDDKTAAFQRAMETAGKYYGEHDHFADEYGNFDRLLSRSLPSCTEDRIYSSGYVVDTLETSIWCFMNHSSTRDIISAAVTLGLDTDTNGIVAGGLGGIFYGCEDIPAEWFDSLAKKDEIDALIDAFVDRIL